MGIFNILREHIVIDEELQNIIIKECKDPKIQRKIAIFLLENKIFMSHLTRLICANCPHNRVLKDEKKQTSNRN